MFYKKLSTSKVSSQTASVNHRKNTIYHFFTRPFFINKIKYIWLNKPHSNSLYSYIHIKKCVYAYNNRQNLEESYFWFYRECESWGVFIETERSQFLLFKFFSSLLFFTLFRWVKLSDDEKPICHHIIFLHPFLKKWL